MNGIVELVKVHHDRVKAFTLSFAMQSRYATEKTSMVFGRKVGGVSPPGPASDTSALMHMIPAPLFSHLEAAVDR